MAYKSVVVDGFFTDLSAALRAVEAARGPFALAMLTPSFPNTRGWDLQVSSAWLDSMPSSRTASKALRAELDTRLQADRSALELIKIRNREDYMVKVLVPTFDVPEFGTAYAFTSLEQTLFELDEVIVLVARPALLEQTEFKLTA